MSISSRNQRVAVYPYLASNDGGYMTTGYAAARGTYFCAVQSLTGNELTIAEQADHKARQVFEFADYIVVSENDLLVDQSDASQWKVESVTLNRKFRKRVARAVKNLDEVALVLPV